MKNNVLAVLLVAVLAFCVYSFMLSAPFKALDDQFSIIENPDIKDLSLWPRVMTSSYFGENHYYRPLVHLTYMLEYRLFGLNPFYFHLTNLILHTAIALLVYTLILAMTNGRISAFFTAVLFAIHPLNSEAVWNIADRAILLAALFSLLSFYWLCVSLRLSRKIPFYAMSLAAFCISLLAKESAAMLPFALAAYLFSQKIQKQSFFQDVILRIAPYFLIIGVYVLIRKLLGITAVFAWNNGTELVLGFASFLKGLLAYTADFIFPVGLYFDRSEIMFASLKDPYLWLVVCVWVSLLAVFLRLHPKRPALNRFFIFWFFAELLPVSQIVTSIGTSPGYISLAEHFFYVASIPAFFLMTQAGLWLYERSIKKRAAAALFCKLLIAGLLIFYAALTVNRSILALSPTAVFEHSLSRNPHNGRLLYSLGLEYAKRGYFKMAEDAFRRGIQEDPSRVIAHIGLGKAVCDQGRLSECADIYEGIKEPGKHRTFLENNLTLTLELILKQYYRMLKERPDDPVVYYSIGATYERIGRGDLAIAAYRKAVSMENADIGLKKDVQMRLNGLNYKE